MKALIESWRDRAALADLCAEGCKEQPLLVAELNGRAAAIRLAADELEAALKAEGGGEDASH